MKKVKISIIVIVSAFIFVAVCTVGILFMNDDDKLSNSHYYYIHELTNPFCDHEDFHGSRMFDSYDEMFSFFSEYDVDMLDTECFYNNFMKKIQQEMRWYMPTFRGNRLDPYEKYFIPEMCWNENTKDVASGVMRYKFQVLEEINTVLNIIYINDEVQKYVNNISLTELVMFYREALAAIFLDKEVVLPAESTVVFDGEERNAIVYDGGDNYCVLLRYDDVLLAYEYINDIELDKLQYVGLENYSFLNECVTEHENSIYQKFAEPLLDDVDYESAGISEDSKFVQVYIETYPCINSLLYDLAKTTSPEKLIQENGADSQYLYTIDKDNNPRKYAYTKSDTASSFYELENDIVSKNNMYKFMCQEAVVEVDGQKLDINKMWLFGMNNLADLVAYYETDNGLYVAAYAEESFNKPYVCTIEEFNQMMKEYQMSSKLPIAEYLRIHKEVAQKDDSEVQTASQAGIGSVWEVVIVVSVSAIVFVLGTICYVKAKKQKVVDE